MFIARSPLKFPKFRRSDIHFAPPELGIKTKIAGYKHFVPNGTKHHALRAGVGQLVEETEVITEKIKQRRVDGWR